MKLPVTVTTLLSDFTFKITHTARMMALRTTRPLSRGQPRSGFFDDYPRFFDTSKTTAHGNRLNERHRAIIEANRDIIRGARVLDIASHDGRWSFAAMHAGASSVLGIEARDHLVNAAVENLKEFGNSSRFRLDDAIEALDHIEAGSIDVVMCLGFFYHITDHMLLLSKIARIQPRHLIIDTGVTPDYRPVVLFQRERHELESDAVKTLDIQQTVLAGIPSRAAIDMMLSSLGWESVYYDWHRAGIGNWQHIDDYQEGFRVTLRASHPSSVMSQSL